MSFGLLNWTVLALYLLAMMLVGWYFMRRERHADDFFRGGGRIPWWAAGMSIYATMLSALTYMGIPAKAFQTDWTYYPILLTILVVTPVVIRFYLPRFRRLRLASAYEYLEVRFGLRTRLLSSGIFIVFMIARMAMTLYLPSLALVAVTGIPIETCIVLMGIVTVCYCTMGGVEAVVWADVVQGVILVGGALLLALWLMWHTEGGVEGYFRLGSEGDKFRLFLWSMDYRQVTFWVAIVGGFANNLISCTSDQTVIQRYLTTPDERSAARSLWTNALLCLFASVLFYFIGAGLYAFYQTHPDQFDPALGSGDAILPFFMMSQMPQGVAGLLIAAIFAATMSTISSNINSVSTAFTVDFWQRLKKAEKPTLRVARLSSLATGAVGLALALLMSTWQISSLIDYFNTILGLLTGGLGGLFLVAVFLPRVKECAALVGFAASTVFVLWLKFCTDANFFLYGAAGMVVCVSVSWLCSLVKKVFVKDCGSC